MLKSLVQLFVETFLKSKKSWVGVQGFPSITETLISATMDATWRTYVAPADGYVVFSGGTSQCLMYNTLGSGVNYGAPRVSLEDLSRFGKVALCTITLKARTALLDSPLLHVSLSKLENGGALC